MSFKLVTPRDTIDARNVPKTTALVTTAGILYQNNLTTGALEAAAAATDANQVLWLANESVSAADARDVVHATQVARLTDLYLVDTTNNSNSAHNGQRMVLNSTGSGLNNTGTDAAAGVFVQILPYGAAADKKILARHV